MRASASEPSTPKKPTPQYSISLGASNGPLALAGDERISNLDAESGVLFFETKYRGKPRRFWITWICLRRGADRVQRKRGEFAHALTGPGQYDISGRK